MAFKYFAVALLVAAMAYTANAQLGGILGGSTGGVGGGAGGLLSGVLDKVVAPLQQVAENLVQAIQLLGQVLDGEQTLPGGLQQILNRVVQILCNVLNLVNNLLAALGGNVGAVTNMCGATGSTGTPVSVPTVAGGLGL